MDENAATTTSYERGAGGKLRKPLRRPPPTPYARPPQNRTQLGGRWLSKIVDPAFRIIAGGANLILPSFFSKSESITNALPAPTGQYDNHGVGETKSLHRSVEQNVAAGEVDRIVTPILLESIPTEVAGSSSKADATNRHSDFDGHEQNRNFDAADSSRLSAIEELMKDKRFSRDEVKRLIEIIKSRSDVDQENKNLGTSTISGYLSTPVALEYSGKETEEKQEESNRAILEDQKYSTAILTDAERPANTFEYSRKSTEGKPEDLDKIIWKTSTPLVQSKVKDDVGTSPVAIARAYMKNRISEVDFGTNNLLSKDEGALPCSDDLALRPFVQSPAPTSSPCWPGAMVQDQHGYMTPQSQRGRFGLHNFPRTPYSRMIHSKAKSKLIQLQSNTDRQSNTIATPFQQTETPATGQVNTRSNALYGGGNGSVGPIRRTRHKVNAHTPSRSAYAQASLNSRRVENLSISEGLFYTPKKNLEIGGTSSPAKFQLFSGNQQGPEVSSPSVPAHSSLVARKILEHLERNPSTPKDKSAELRLVTSRMKPQPSDETPPILPVKLNSLTNLGGTEASEKSVQVNRNGLRYSTNEVNALKAIGSASDMNFGAASTHIDCAGPSQDSIKSLDFQFMNSHEDVRNSKVMPNSAAASTLQKKLPPPTSGTKPVLPNISIHKPNERWTVSSSDNSSGFTFPVSSSGVSSEPPTPSILPSSSSIGLNQQNEDLSVPLYSFGSGRSKSNSALVFSFPSSSSAPLQGDASDPKFNFGSDDTKRLSFSNIGQDTICY